MREDDSALLQAGGRRRSADQYVDSMKMQLMFGVLVRAMQFLKLADTSRLPVERTTLKDLLRKWGAFPHIGSGNCPVCDARGEAQADSVAVLAAPLEARVINICNVDIDIEKIQVCPPHSQSVCLQIVACLPTHACLLACFCVHYATAAYDVLPCSAMPNGCSHSIGDPTSGSGPRTSSETSLR